MNLHEYQAKELLKKFNVPVQEGIVCNSALQTEEAYRQIHSQYQSKFAVVKAQIHAGGRGKGKIEGTVHNKEHKQKKETNAKQENTLDSMLLIKQPYK